MKIQISQSIYLLIDDLGKPINYCRNLNLDSIRDEELLTLLQNPRVRNLSSLGLLVEYFTCHDAHYSQKSTEVTIKSNPLSYTVNNEFSKLSISIENLSFFTKRKCAEVWLQINQTLSNLDPKLGLVDSHFGNFAFDHNLKPIWIDLDSFVEIRSGAEGLTEFRSCLARPLIAIYLGPNLSLGIRKTGSLSPRALSHITKIPSLSFKGILLSLGIPIYLERKYKVNLSILRRLLLISANLSLPSIFLPRRGYRSNYSKKNIYNIDPQGARETSISEVISKLSFESVADVGGNEGRFLWLATQGGSRNGVLYDTDDRSVSKFCKHVYEFNHKYPEKGTVGLIGLVSSVDDIKNKFDLVLALALTHHLLLSQHWKLEKLSKKLFEITNNFLLVEFMPNGVGILQSTYSTPPNWYNLENFLTSLRKQFLTAEVVSENEGRILILATK